MINHIIPVRHIVVSEGHDPITNHETRKPLHHQHSEDRMLLWIEQMTETLRLNSALRQQRAQTWQLNTVSFKEHREVCLKENCSRLSRGKKKSSG